VFNTVFSIALGFFGAVFLMLLVAPSIARRISDLTWRQAERVLPQSMEEIAASRDKLRGGFALEMRKLEMAHEALTERHNSNRVDLVKVTDRAAVLDAELAATAKALADERLAGEELAATLSAVEQERDAERTRNADLAIRIEAFTSELRRLTQESTSLSIAVERARSDAVDEQARFKKMQEARDGLRQRLEDSEKAVRLARAQLRAAEAANRQAVRRSDALEAKIARLTTDLASAEFKVAQRQPTVQAPAVQPATVPPRKTSRKAANDPAPAAIGPVVVEQEGASRQVPAETGGELRRQMTAFRKVLPQAATDEAARERLARPLTEIAAIAVAEAVEASAPGSPIRNLAADSALAESPLGQAIKRRLHKQRG
jgi:hypothetical protein